MVLGSEVIFEGLKNFWDVKLFSDVEVVVGHQTFHLHRIILSAHSPVFHAMFTSGMVESLGHVKLEATHADVVEEILKFMYTGMIEITNSNVRDVMYVADLFLIRRLVKLCSDHMLQHLDVLNCVDVLLIAQAHSCSDLKQSALNFICQNFAHVARTTSFLDIDIDQVTLVLDMKELPSSNEEDVLKAALSWINYDISKRRVHSFSILSTVRFRALTLREINNVMVTSSPELIKDKSLAVVMSSIRRDLFTGQLFRNPQFCKPKRGTSYIMLFGGATTESFRIGCGSTCVYRYDTVTGSWLELESFKMGRYKHAMSVIGTRIYLLGGNNEYFSVTSSVECYNITTGVWTTVAPMLECRIPMVTVVNGRMYVSSVDDADELSTDLEVYDSGSNVWLPYESSLRWQPEVNSASRCYKDSDPDDRFDIGVFGEAYYPYPPLHQTRHNSVMVFVNDYLYLIGGRDSQSTDCGGKSVVQLHLRKNRWRRVAAMTAAREGHTAESVDGKIYVFGGQKCSQDPNNCFMEVYDPDIDIWEPRDQPVNFMFSTSTVY